MLTELHQYLARDMRTRHPNLPDDELFLLWFVIAYLVGASKEEQALASLTGVSKDKDIDAIHIDDKSKRVYLVQGKYRKKGAAQEGRNAVLGFARLAEIIVDEDPRDWDALLKGMHEGVAQRLREARTRVVTGGYGLRLMFVTSGRVSRALVREAEGVVRKPGRDTDLEVVVGSRLALIYRDYMDGVAPPIPTVELEVEEGTAVVKGLLQRYDAGNCIESWVFPMRAVAVSELYHNYGIRLFARNIRGFLGETTSVNRSIEVTLKREPQFFFYYNNGITIVCDEAELLSTFGKQVLRVGNAQIINGQQTTRMLAAQPHPAHASVLVKVVRIPRTDGKGPNHFETLVSQIVAGTNRQSAVKAADLMANDSKQVDLERELRKRGYGYVRKRQTKSEARAAFGRSAKWMLNKEDLAQAIAGCELDPAVPRAGKDNLFNEEYYPRVFPNSDPSYYLPRYWLMRSVTYGARGYPQRGYAKWLVLGFLWNRLRPALHAKHRADGFVRLHERRDLPFLAPLDRAVDEAFKLALRYYRSARGRGEAAEDVSRFFRNKKGRDKEFRAFIDKDGGRQAEKLDRAVTKTIEYLDAE